MSHSELEHRSHIKLLAPTGSVSVAQILVFTSIPGELQTSGLKKKEVVLNSCFSINNVLCLKFLFCFLFFNFEQFVMYGCGFF